MNVQYEPDPARPMARMLGSSRAARWPGEFIHMVPIEAPLPIAEFCRRAGPMT